VQSVIADERIKKILKERPLLAVNGFQSQVGSTPDPKTGKTTFDVTYITTISEFRTGRAPLPPANFGRQPQPR
jgi:hypothetical protein